MPQPPAGDRSSGALAVDSVDRADVGGALLPVIGDQQRAVAMDEDVHWAPPSVRRLPGHALSLPAGHELLIAHRLAVLRTDADDHGSDRNDAIPRPVQREQRIAAVLRRELRGAIEEG